jgi:hypothetical protein
VSQALTGPGAYSIDALLGLSSWWTPQSDNQRACGGYGRRLYNSRNAPSGLDRRALHIATAPGNGEHPVECLCAVFGRRIETCQAFR